MNEFSGFKFKFKFLSLDRRPYYAVETAVCTYIEPIHFDTNVLPTNYFQPIPS